MSNIREDRYERAILQLRDIATKVSVVAGDVEEVIPVIEALENWPVGLGHIDANRQAVELRAQALLLGILHQLPKCDSEEQGFNRKISDIMSQIMM